MSQIWNTTGVKLHPKILEYTSQNDALLDEEIFLPYDLDGTLAHAIMLEKIGILTQEELQQANECIQQIFLEYKNGEFKIPDGMEDCHTAIESRMTESYPQLGKKIHTARSRNDQALTMIRLFMKDQYKIISIELSGLVEQWQQWSLENKDVPMPGYTHMQKAMPTSVDVWQSSFADALLDLQVLFSSVHGVFDQSPLGSGAGFGVPLNVDKKMTADQMGFAKVQENPMYCQFSRGLFESNMAFSLLQMMTVLSRWAGDVLLFTMSEFDFFELPSEYCTSSSIMPQKKNYDALEIMRGSVSAVSGSFTEIQQLQSHLHSGYHRDLQLLKKPLVDCCKTVLQSLQVAKIVSENLQVKKENLKGAMASELYATEKVYKLVEEGVPFRDAYAKIKESL